MNDFDPSSLIAAANSLQNSSSSGNGKDHDFNLKDFLIIVISIWQGIAFFIGIMSYIDPFVFGNANEWPETKWELTNPMYYVGYKTAQFLDSPLNKSFK